MKGFQYGPVCNMDHPRLEKTRAAIAILIYFFVTLTSLSSFDNMVAPSAKEKAKR